MADKEIKNIDELAQLYRMKEYGYIATGYTKEQEEAVFEAVSKVIYGKYSDIVDYNEINQRLCDGGNIYTIYNYKTATKEGLFDWSSSGRSNILISYFLKKLTENLIHECVHKIGFANADDSFLNMNSIIRECGTEIVASSAFSTSYSKVALFPSIWGRFPKNTNAYLLGVSLINQLNVLVGGKSLEKTILKGHDYFKEAIESKYGEDKYNEIIEEFNDIYKKSNKYDELIGIYGISNSKVISYGNNFFQQVKSFENKILKLEYDKKFTEIENINDAKNFLMELNSFGENRLKDDDFEDEYKDISLKNIFEEYKEKLEEKYGSIDVEFKESKIAELQKIEFEDNRESGEIEQIQQMAMEFEIESRKRLKQARKEKRKHIFESIFGKKKKSLMPVKSSEALEVHGNNGLENHGYSVNPAISSNVVSHVNSENHIDAR